MQKSVGELMQKLASETSRVIMCPFQVYIAHIYECQISITNNSSLGLIGVLSDYVIVKFLILLHKVDGVAASLLSGSTTQWNRRNH